MIPLKKNFTYLILDDRGLMDGRGSGSKKYGECGGYLLDTRVLSRYQWDLANFSLMKTEYVGSRSIIQYFCRFEAHKQELLIKRELHVLDGGFKDILTITNDDIEAHSFSSELVLDSDFVDMFEVRGHVFDDVKRNVEIQREARRYQASYTEVDGNTTSVDVSIEGSDFSGTLELEARTQATITVTASFKSDLEIGNHKLDVSEHWLNSKNSNMPIYKQAALDLHDLLLATEHGTTIAAGIPWFVTPFGRDSIITSWFLLKSYPSLARGTLKFLAAHQGTKTDEYRDEQPGKILHEQRYAEMSRCGRLPFHTYFGTADATALFLMLLHDYCEEVGDFSLAESLKPQWLAAVNWLETYKNDKGLIVFKGNSEGLTVQSWKDSNDSLSYSDGRLGQGALSVAEVQGYCFAAYHAVSVFYRKLNDDERATEYAQKAEKLKEDFDRLFWMPQHNNYAIALDEDGQQLNTNSSDSGHLLWSGIVPDDKVEILVARLFEPDLWSGWGLRTLSTQEKRYNPSSYHNGSVWPHDTAIFAAGLKRLGKDDAFNTIREALMATAQTQPDKRLPELFSGYPRGDMPVLPYIEACRPQAWSSAALIYLINHGESAR